MRRTTLLLLGLAALPLAACGDDDEGGGGDVPVPEGAVVVVAEPGLDFDSDTYEASAGEVTFVYENADAIAHTLVIEDVDDFKLEVGETDQGTVELEAGDYVLFCDVPGHRGGGMEATLTVE
jgi:plastocyanin